MKSPARRRVMKRWVATGAAALVGTWVTRAAVAQAPREIEMVARRFNFTPRDIALKVNEPVVLLVRSLDFVHGFNVPDLGVRADLMPGRVTRIDLLPKKAGIIEFVCDNFCGSEHEEMHGRFVVSG
jgi:cytochrome c oxidase subunit II